MKNSPSPALSPEALQAIYNRHFGDSDDTPEKLLRDMLCCIIDSGVVNNAELQAQVLNHLCLSAFIEELLSSLRTPGAQTSPVINLN